MRRRAKQCIGNHDKEKKRREEVRHVKDEFFLCSGRWQYVSQERYAQLYTHEGDLDGSPQTVGWGTQTAV